MKNITIFHLKITIFTAVKYCSILHGRSRNDANLILIVPTSGCSCGIWYQLDLYHLHILRSFKARLRSLLLYQFRDIALYSPAELTFYQLKKFCKGNKSLDLSR